MMMFLASPHTFLNFRGGGNWRKRRLWGISMLIYLAGGVSGNLKPAWKLMQENTPSGFVKALTDANFWRGGSRGIGYRT